MDKGFESYLMQIYIDDKHPLDDDMSDGFDDWLVDQHLDDLIKWANEYAELEKREAVEGFVKSIRLNRDAHPLYAWTDMEHLKEDMRSYLNQQKEKENNE